MWIDAHCHLDAKSWPEGSDAVLERARAAGVTGFVVVGVEGPESARAAAELAARRGDVWAVVGVHPHEAAGFAATWPEIEPLLGRARVVAVGETGLDYHYRFSSPAEQAAAFRAASSGPGATREGLNQLPIRPARASPSSTAASASLRARSSSSLPAST